MSFMSPGSRSTPGPVLNEWEQPPGVAVPRRRDARSRSAAFEHPAGEVDEVLADLVTVEVVDVEAGDVDDDRAVAVEHLHLDPEQLDQERVVAEALERLEPVLLLVDVGG